MFGSDECDRCREDFPALARRTGGRQAAFLDGPAGTQVPRQVIEAVGRYYETSNANSGGGFATSRETDALLDDARATVAAFLGAGSGREISFGQNMTTLAFSLSHALSREIEPGDEVVVTQLDHEANRAPWLGLERHGVVVREAALLPDGRLDYEQLESLVGPRTRLVAMGLASNALGTVNETARIREITREHGAWLLLDAVHYAAHLSVDVAALDADFLLCSPYKFYGPHLGVLHTRPGLLDRLEPDRLRTQSQLAPWRIETGTLNHAAIAGVKAAVEYIASWGEGGDLRSRIVSAVDRIAAWEHQLGRRLWDGLREIPGARTWGPGFESPERAPTVAATFEGHDPRDLAQRLGDRGIHVWHGHFYAIRAIEVLGLSDRGGVLRTGFSMYNTPEEVDRLLEALAELAPGPVDTLRA